ncbi:MAG: prepilin-type N-terminal cleavage/methylation domain-containing protein [Phycisphaerae bacterium]
MKRKGFTLVEILIVVIILGILAAIVIPQFTEASSDARNSALRSDLQTVRSQIELYKVQHLDKFPGWDGTTVDAADFVKDMTTKTNVAGTQESGDGPLNFGPYLQKFPSNTYVDENADAISVGSDPCPGDGSTGWYLNTTTGTFSPNDAENKDL